MNTIGRAVTALPAIALALLVASFAAQAQQPKMFPGTNFPGNDLFSVGTGNPEDCANRCLAESRCKAFTWIINERRCMLKWNSSTFDGSFNAVSGIIEGRSVSPPPSAATTAEACSVPDAPPCAGCSVTCAPGQKASCSPGTAGNDGTCAANSRCQCQ